MSSTNFIILIGRLGSTPEIKETAKTTIANLSLATNYRYKKDGEYVEQTDWHRVICFGHQANFISQYAEKGALISVEGRVQTRNYDDANGEKRYITEVIANKVNLLAKSTQRTPEPQTITPVSPSPAYDKVKDGIIDNDIPF